MPWRIRIKPTPSLEFRDRSTHHRDGLEITDEILVLALLLQGGWCLSALGQRLFLNDHGYAHRTPPAALPWAPRGSKLFMKPCFPADPLGLPHVPVPWIRLVGELGDTDGKTPCLGEM